MVDLGRFGENCHDVEGYLVHLAGSLALDVLKYTL